MTDYQQEKKLVRQYFSALEAATPETVADVLQTYLHPDAVWYGVYPFRQQSGIHAIAETFWKPFMTALTAMQRRQDIFIGGTNEMHAEPWVMSMGHFMGLFDRPFLGIAPTGKMVNVRYAEFHCIEQGKITKTGLFIDVIGLMAQAGCYPLPPATGQYFVYPGPRHHDGLLFHDAPQAESEKTLALVNRMVDDLSTLNDSGSMGCPPEILERSWSNHMIWYGPCGIGASYTIPRYQQQHQLPFREQLTDKQFNGHICRFAEGNFACFFGWPNLTNTPIGGFLGLPGGQVPAHMQVVDIYYREGDKLSENWVLIDIPYWLKQQGLDVLARNKMLNAF